MGILFAFAPFVAFAVVDLLINPVAGLVAGALTSLALLVRDWLSPNRSPKILELGSAILFSGLALYAIFGQPTWSIIGVRLRVDAGLLIIVLFTMALGKPFTIQYAREQVAASLWNSREFLRTNYIITAAWAVAFAILVLADLLMLYRPDVPRRVGIIITVLALVASFKFTSWYPERIRSQP